MAKRTVEDSSDDEPMIVKSESNQQAKPKAKKIKVEKKEKIKKEKEEKEDSPEKEDDDEEEERKWWLEEKEDNGIKWTTLQHQGPLFPPPYEPHGVKMLYDVINQGKPVELTPAAEEVASFYAALLGTDNGNNPVFQKNFFADFLKTIKQEKIPNCPIKEFSKCDFTPIFDYLNKVKEEKKQMSKEEKKKLKEEKEAIDEIYGWCTMDGRKEKVGNYRIEPPGLFRGRGEHPKTGCLKLRVQPEQVTINIGADAKIPDPPKGHSWGTVSHDNTVTWLAMWKENVNESTKYIFLAATSSLKGQSDMKKFEKARELKVRQLATCLYFIDKLALRAGNEKGEDEADTVGCCSLRYEHITLEPPNKVVFDFLGKDSIRYVNTVEVIDQVYKNLKIFKKEPKTVGDDLFDRINEELRKTPADGTIAEKVLAYNRANRQVAVLCNHQRAVPKSHGTQMSRLTDKILAVKYQRQEVKQQILELEPSLKKQRPELLEPESDLDDEFIKRHEIALEEKEKERLEKLLIKENEKRKENGEELLNSLPEQKKKQTIPTMDKLEKKLQTLTDRIQAQKMQMVDKDENKQTALGTSKINYIDPRISAAWCNKYNVPLDKIFNRSLREKFKWAMESDKDWEF
ncbi:DNA topoisomerase 1 [Boothiomyces macroporosus]|uniref:DNA topoisomerase 1 n=1 Tax=Boothiomyces macroporosus TaxID=261099 RepID=A0AAD5Y0U0_9FUNG|nr:DNA topoisomerase 1 [Boothiomyces macroporosus]